MLPAIKMRSAIVGALLSTCMCYSAHATTINFDAQGITGPSLYGGTVAVTQTINTVDGNVIFSGGTFLTQTANLPVDQTTVYGTISLPNQGFTNPLTVTFANPVTNFFLDVLNGNTVPVDYTVADNAGNSATFLLAPNLSSGTTTIGFAATGTVVTITAALVGQAHSLIS